MPFYGYQLVFMRRLRNVGLLFCVFCVFPALAAKRCDWHAQNAYFGETAFRKCLDLAALDGKSLDMPKNVSRLSYDGLSICQNAFKSDKTGEADILYLLDNSGSMWTGENNGQYNSCAGDPFERRGDVVIQGMRLQSQLASHSTAGFIPFVAGNPGLQTKYVKAPVDITPASPQGATRLQDLTKQVGDALDDAAQNRSNTTDPCAKFRGELMKAGATERAQVTYWTEALKKAIEWRKDDPLYKAAKKPAIILISDGAIEDWDNVKKLIPQLPPVYGLHLGYRLNRDKKIDMASAQLDTLTRLTGGKFYRVAPDDTSAMHQVMATIIRSVVSNPLPKSVKVTNTSLSTPQVSVAKDLKANPDTSLAVSLDSVLALREGGNQLRIEVSLDDTTTRQYTVNFNASGAAADRNGNTYACYDLPTLAMLDASGKIPELYTADASTYTIRLTRSPSELQGVTVMATSSDSTRSDAATWGDRESIALKAPSMVSGIAEHKQAQAFNPRSGSPKPGNDVLESNQSGSVTLTWTHPRDSRETVTYTLPGKIIPVVDPVGELQPPKEPAQGPTTLEGLKSDAPSIILFEAPKVEGGALGACLSGCEVLTQTGAKPGQFPTWNLPVNAPFDFSYRVYDNLGQFVRSGAGELTAEQFDQVRKNSDTAKVAISFVPVAHNGRHLATGAYIMHLEANTHGEVITRNAAGDEVRVRSTQVQQVRRFGYVRTGE